MSLPHMRPHRSYRTFLALLVPLLTCLVASAQPGVRVEFVVTVTAPLAPSDTVHLSGSHASLGPWSPDALPLTRRPDGRWSATLTLPPGTPLEFKFTLGNWDTVERTTAGADVPNRTFTVPDLDSALDLVVARFTPPAAAASRPSAVVGTLRLHPDIRSEALGNSRTLRVWLPPGYDDESDRRYPVIYFHDGQNLFDAATSAFGTEWQLDEAMTRLIAEQKVRPAILVGIDNTPARIPEYTADPPATARGQIYTRFIVEEIKPFIDGTYRTHPDRPNTFTAGSSLGGLISLQLLRTHPDLFGGAAVVSPALWWANEAELRRWANDPPPLPPGTRLWLDMGTAEGAANQSARHLDTTRRLRDALAARDSLTLHYEEADGAAHNEPAWAARAPQILQFLLSP